MKYDFSKLFIQYWLWSLIFETFILASYFVPWRTFPSRTIFDAYASNNAQLMIRFNRCLTLKNEWRVAHSIRIMLMWRIVRLISKLWRKAFTPQMLWLLASFDLNNIRAMIKKMSSYQYRKSHRADKTVIRLSYLHNGISPESKMSSMYRTRNHLYGLTCTAMEIRRLLLHMIW